jgi:TadE-like protein
LSALARFFRDRDDQRGQSLVEFALLLPVMLLIITGLFDVARAVWQENTLAYAAREGTRYAIVHGSASPSAAGPCNPCATPVPAIVAVVNSAAIGVPNITVTTRWPDSKGGTPCNDRNCRVIVDTAAPFVPLPSQYLLGGAFTITLRGGSQLVIQR